MKFVPILNSISVQKIKKASKRIFPVSDKKNPDPILKNKNYKLDAICAGKRQYREKRLLWIALEERT